MATTTTMGAALERIDAVLFFTNEAAYRNTRMPEKIEAEGVRIIREAHASTAPKIAVTTRLVLFMADANASDRDRVLAAADRAGARAIGLERQTSATGWIRLRDLVAARRAILASPPDRGPRRPPTSKPADVIFRPDPAAWREGDEVAATSPPPPPSTPPAPVVVPPDGDAAALAQLYADDLRAERAKLHALEETRHELRDELDRTRAQIVVRDQELAAARAALEAARKGSDAEQKDDRARLRAELNEARRETKNAVFAKEQLEATVTSLTASVQRAREEILKIRENDMTMHASMQEIIRESELAIRLWGECRGGWNPFLAVAHLDDMIEIGGHDNLRGAPYELACAIIKDADDDGRGELVNLNGPALKGLEALEAEGVLAITSRGPDDAESGNPGVWVKILVGMREPSPDVTAPKVAAIRNALEAGVITKEDALPKLLALAAAAPVIAVRPLPATPPAKKSEKGGARGIAVLHVPRDEKASRARTSAFGPLASLDSGELTRPSAISPLATTRETLAHLSAFKIDLTAKEKKK